MPIAYIIKDADQEPVKENTGIEIFLPGKDSDLRSIYNSQTLAGQTSASYGAHMPTEPEANKDINAKAPVKQRVRRQKKKHTGLKAGKIAKSKKHTAPQAKKREGQNISNLYRQRAQPIDTTRQDPMADTEPQERDKDLQEQELDTPEQEQDDMEGVEFTESIFISKQGLNPREMVRLATLARIYLDFMSPTQKLGMIPANLSEYNIRARFFGKASEILRTFGYRSSRVIEIKLHIKGEDDPWIVI